MQSKVEEIITNVMKLDLGDAASNKDIKAQMNKYQEENKYITAQLSQRSKASNKSYKSNFTIVSKKTNKAKPDTKYRSRVYELDEHEEEKEADN